MVGSEVYSSEVKKTEVLMENFRRAIGEVLSCPTEPAPGGKQLRASSSGRIVGMRFDVRHALDRGTLRKPRCASR